MVVTPISKYAFNRKHRFEASFNEVTLGSISEVNAKYLKEAVMKYFEVF
jgi:hypothetical protein